MRIENNEHIFLYAGKSGISARGIAAHWSLQMPHSVRRAFAGGTSNGSIWSSVGLLLNSLHSDDQGSKFPLFVAHQGRPGQSRAGQGRSERVRAE